MTAMIWGICRTFSEINDISMFSSYVFVRIITSTIEKNDPNGEITMFVKQ